jgi:prepilin-type N-terminal cleavage/methylation domain-containing protein
LKVEGAHHSTGFTLFELMVVLLLLGFVLLLTFPSFREHVGPGDLKRAVLGFTGTLRYAQDQAAKTKHRTRLNLDLKESAYWITVEAERGKFNRDASSLGQRMEFPAGVRLVDVQYAVKGKLREGLTTLDFSPSGWAEECALHLQKGDQAFTIFVQPLGGRVEVVSGYVEREKP